MKDIGIENISISNISYEELGAKINLELIDSCEGKYHSTITCQNVIYYKCMSIEEERSICAIFILDLYINRVGRDKVLDKIGGILPKNYKSAIYYQLSAFSGESEIELICTEIKINRDKWNMEK